MAFPTSSAQQAETNRKILEDIQLKKQLLLQKGGATPIAGSIIGSLGNTGLNSQNINQMPATQLLGPPTEFQQQVPPQTQQTQPTNASGLTAPRSTFNPTSSSTLGFFIPQDSYFGNSFIPVLPRLEPLPTTHNISK